MSFNVITGVPAGIVDTHTAVQMAGGTYGWWKAKERSVSLTEMIATHGRLAPSTNFNKFRYETARHTTKIHGIARYDGRLESFPCFSSSTANIEDEGLLCLCAITTALLTIYDVKATTAILGRIIPRSLVNYDSGDCRLAVDCPVLESIR